MTLKVVMVFYKITSSGIGHSDLSFIDFRKSRRKHVVDFFCKCGIEYAKGHWLKAEKVR